MTKQADLMRMKGYITVAEAARRTGLSVYRIYELLDDGKLQGMNLGQPPRPRRYVSAASLVEYIGPEGAKALGLTKEA